MARLASGGSDVISRCLRSRARQDRDDLANSGEIIRGGSGMGPGEVCADSLSGLVIKCRTHIDHV